MVLLAFKKLSESSFLCLSVYENFNFKPYASSQAACIIGVPLFKSESHVG